MPYFFTQTCHSRLQDIASWGRWCNGRIMGTQRESSSFESDPSHCIAGLSKLFTPDWLLRFFDGRREHCTSILILQTHSIISDANIQYNTFNQAGTLNKHKFQ